MTELNSSNFDRRHGSIGICDSTPFIKVLFSIFTIHSNLKCGFISTKENAETKIGKQVYRTEYFYIL